MADGPYVINRAATGSQKNLLMIIDKASGDLDFTIPEGMTFEEAKQRFREFMGGLRADGFGAQVEKMEQHRHDDGDDKVRVSSAAR